MVSRPEFLLRAGLVEFEQRHAVQIGDFARASIAQLFVEAYGALQRCGGVQSDASAILAAKFGFGVLKQHGGDSGALPGWKNCHAPEMSLAAVHGLASNRSNDLAGGVLTDENPHVRETVLESFRSEDGIEVSSGAVRVAKGREGRVQAG